MIITTDVVGKAYSAKSGFKGRVTAWSLMPFWIGKSAAELETVRVVKASTNVPIEIRDGIYLRPSGFALWHSVNPFDGAGVSPSDQWSMPGTPTSGPVCEFSWEGNLWVLTGGGQYDIFQPVPPVGLSNVISLLFFPC